MDENIPPAPVGHLQQPIGDEYTWEHVRNDMEKWHPSLREIAAHHLELNGITPPGVTAEDTVQYPREELPQPEDRFEAPPRPEGYKTSKEERETGLAFGKKNIYRLLSETAFHTKLGEAGLKPDDDAKPEYWQVFASFTQERVQGILTKGGETVPPASRFKLRILELMAATPAYVFAQARAGTRQPFATSEQWRTTFEHINGLHNLITDTAEQFPDMKASDLELGLLNSVNMSINNKGTRQFANQDIKARIRAVQHEMGFDDILRQTGIRYRKAEPAEDVQGGFDFITNEGERSQMKLDVKASLRQVDPDEGKTPITKKNSGVYAVYSLISDHEFRDSFRISDRAARDKAEVLLRYIGPDSDRATIQSAS